MPSLLDLAMMRQNPLMNLGPDPQDGKSQILPGGLPLAGPAGLPLIPAPGGAQGAAPGGGGVPEEGTPAPAEGTGGFLSQLFAGGDDLNLTPDQNEKIRRQAMLVSGLATLANAGQGVSAIPRGILAGQQVAGQAREKALSEKQAAEMQENVSEALADGNIRRLRQIQGQLAVSGQAEAAEGIGSILQGLGAGAKSIEIDLEPGRKALVNPVSNEIEREFIFEPEREVVSSELGDRVIYHYKGEPQNILAMHEIGVSPDTAARIAADARKAALERARMNGRLTEEQEQSVNTIADDYRQEVSKIQSVADAARLLNEMPEDDPAADLALVMAFTRISDPGVSVRQSDVENAENVGGLSAKAQAWINRLAREGQFGPEARQALKNEGLRIARETREGNLHRVARFTERARGVGIPEDMIPTIVYDPFAGMDLDPVAAAERRLRGEQ